MNVKKTALATAIALTMAGGGGSAWAETSTVEGQFILDKTEVTGGETVNLALLGLNVNKEVDRFGEEKGSTIMAVVETIKGKIQGGSSHPGSIPDASIPLGGNFASEVRYVMLNQGVGRVNIFYDEEIVDADDTTDTLTVFLQERIPTADGGVRFERIGQPVDKTITIKAGTTEPIGFSVTSYQPSINDPIQKPIEMPDPVEEDWALMAEMTAGYSGAVFKVVGDEDLQGTTRAALLVTLSIQEPNRGEVIYTDTQRMIRGEVYFSVTAEIEKAGLYDVIVSLDGKDEINNIRMLSKDTLRVWPRKTPAKSKLTADKTRVARGAAAVYTDAGTCNGSLVCQGTKLTLTLLDEFGNEITPWTNLTGPLVVDVKDGNTNKIFADKQATLAAGQVKTEWTWGDHSNEILRIGTTSLIASSQGIANSETVAIKVVNSSLSATATELFEHDMADPNDQKAGTEFDAFTVVIKNNVGNTVMNGALTQNPGPITVTTSAGEAITIERKLDVPVDAVEVYYEKTTMDNGEYANKYLLSDTGGIHGQVWATGSKIIPAAAFKVTLHNAIGDEITTVAPRYDLDEKRYITKLPERSFRMSDAYDNLITENVGEFNAKTPNATIKYVDTKGTTFGEVARTPGGQVHVTYNPTTSPGDDQITMTFKKPALSSKTLQITTTIPEALEAGLGSIKSFIEQNDLPVNSEVALKVETLDKQGKLFKNASLVVTVTFNEEEEALAAIDLDPDSEEPDYLITPTVYELEWREVSVEKDGVVVQERRQVENFVASGSRLVFGEGRKLFVVEAGPRPGKFSLTFKDANNPSMKESRVFKVTNEIVVEVEVTQEVCEGRGDRWFESASVCKPLEDIGNPIPGKATSAVVKPNGTIDFSSNAHFKGGVAVDNGDFATNGAVELTPEGSEVLIAGNIEFDSAHVGETVDIILAISYQVGGPFNPTFWFTYADGEFVVWSGDPAELGTFQEHTIVKDENLPITVLNTTLVQGVTPGTIGVYFGYRLADGDVHFNGKALTLYMQ